MSFVNRFFLHTLLAIGLTGAAGGALAAPKIQHWTTPNGARVYFVPAPELPMADVRVVFDAGSSRDGEKEGLAQLTSALLGEGAGDLNADQIAERLESLGAQFGASAMRDMASVSLRTLTDPAQMNPALDTLALILQRPSFPADAFAREQSRMRVALRAEQESPDEIAERAFYAVIYGQHPYAASPSGTDETVAALTRADAQAFYQRYYAARNAVVAIVGALDRKQAEAVAKRVLGKLPAGEQAPPLPKVEGVKKGEVQRITYPSEQTHILLGQPGLRRGDPDYFALYLGNHALGGSGLVSRISDEIREKRGLSYNAYSYFIPMRNEGPFIAGLQTRNDQAEEALAVLKQTLADFIAQGPTPEELTASRKNITGGFPLRLDSNAKIVENLAAIGFYKLPLDYLDTFNAKIEALTGEQVRDAFRRRLDPEKMSTVIVGGGAVTTVTSDE